MPKPMGHYRLADKAHGDDCTLTRYVRDGSGEVMSYPVTQADRIVAAVLYSNKRDHDYAGWILAGQKDSDPEVQAFAKHRIEALDAAAKVARELYSDQSWHPYMKLAADNVAETIDTMKDHP